MKLSFLCAAALSLSVSVAALAADAPAIKSNAMVRTSDGTRVGRVDRVINGADGATSSVQIIYKGRFVRIPVESLTTGETGLVTSLTAKEVNKL